MKKTIAILMILSLPCILFAEKIKIKSITATSTLESKTNLYDVSHLIDGTEKSWVEGEDGSGIATRITIKFDKTEKIKSFYIKNGYGDFKHFYENNRVKNLDLYFFRGFVNITLKDEFGFQKVEFDAPISTDEIELAIKSVYKGTKFDDTAIAEISFDDWENLNHSEINSSVLEFSSNDIFECYKKKDSMIQQRVKQSIFSKPRIDSRHGEDWFLTSCRQNLIPLKDGSLYFLSFLPVEYMGQKRESSGIEGYFLFSKLRGEKIVPCQSEFLEQFIPLLPEKFQEDLTAAQKSNLPFRADQTFAVVDKESLELTFGGLYIRCQPSIEIISEVSMR